MGRQRSALVRAVLLVLTIADVSCSVYSLCGNTDVGIPSNSLVVITAGCTQQTSLVLGQQLPQSPPGTAQHSGIVANISIITVSTKVLPTVTAANGTTSVTNVSYFARDCSAGEAASVLLAPLVDMVASNTIANITITLVNVDLRLDATSVVSLRPSAVAMSIVLAIENTSIMANLTKTAFAINSRRDAAHVLFSVLRSAIAVSNKYTGNSIFQVTATNLLHSFRAIVQHTNISCATVCSTPNDEAHPNRVCGLVTAEENDGAVVDARITNREGVMHSVECVFAHAQLVASIEVPSSAEVSLHFYGLRVAGFPYYSGNQASLHDLYVRVVHCLVRLQASAYPTVIQAHDFPGGVSRVAIDVQDCIVSSVADGPVNAIQSARAVSLVNIVHLVPLKDAHIQLAGLRVLHRAVCGLDAIGIAANVPSTMVTVSSDLVLLRECSNVTVVIHECRLTSELRNGTMPGLSTPLFGRAALAIVGVALFRLSGQATSLAKDLNLTIVGSALEAWIAFGIHRDAARGMATTHLTLGSMEARCTDCVVRMSACSVRLLETVVVDAAPSVSRFMLQPSLLFAQPSFKACLDFFSSDPSLSLIIPVLPNLFPAEYLVTSTTHTRVHVYLDAMTLGLSAPVEGATNVAAVVFPPTETTQGSSIFVGSVAPQSQNSGSGQLGMRLLFCFCGCNVTLATVVFKNISGVNLALLQVFSVGVVLRSSTVSLLGCTTSTVEAAGPTVYGLLSTVAGGAQSGATIQLYNCSVVIAENSLGNMSRLAHAAQGSILWDDTSVITFGCNTVGLHGRPLPGGGLDAFLDNVPRHLVQFSKLLLSTKHGCFLPWSRTVSHSLTEEQPPAESSAYIPPYAASASLSTVLNVAAGMDALPLVAMGQSQCGSAAMGSSSSLSQFLLSPLFPFGVAAAAAGNVAILVVVVSLHYSVVVLKSKSEPHAKSAAANGRSLSLRHRIAYVFAPCHFPNLSIVVSAYVLQGTAFFGTRALSQGSAGSVFAGLTVVAAFCCVAYLWRRFERSDAASLFKYHSYRQAHSTSRLGRCARWCLPHGYWGNAAMRGSVGRLRNFVRCSKATAGNESTISVLVTVVVPCCGQALMGIDAPSSGTWWCPVQWLLLMVLSLATSVGLFWVRPARVPLAGVFMGVLYALQASLFAASFVAVPSIGNPKTAADVLVVLSMLYTIVAILKTMLALATFRWEAVHRDKRVDVKAPPVKGAARGHGTNDRVRSSSVLASTDTGSALLQVPMPPPRELDGSDEVQIATRDRLQNLTALIELIAMNVHVREL